MNSTAKPEPPPEGLLEVGVITKPHGLEGEVSVKPVSNQAERFAPSSIFETSQGKLTVVTARQHKDRWLLRFEEITGRNAAEALAGCPLWAAPPTDETELWVHNLIGSRVVDQHGTARGQVIAVQANPASDLLVLNNGSLVPLAFLVDGEESTAGQLTVDVPEGLFELNSEPFRVDVFTIFPDEVAAMARLSILGRAQDKSLLRVDAHDLRMAATDPHRSVDDSPFGGGPGMILSPEPAFAAVRQTNPARPLLLLDAAGRRFDQTFAAELAAGEGFSLLCGRYEGVDERIRTELVDGTVSVGDVVLAGGEFAALVVIEAVSRLLPGVLGNAASAQEESFADGLLEHPQWTRPQSFEGSAVPEILLSGDHAKIARWRRCMSLLKTAQLRPDLLINRPPTAEEHQWLAEFGIELPV